MLCDDKNGCWFIFISENVSEIAYVTHFKFCKNANTILGQPVYVELYIVKTTQPFALTSTYI